MKTTLSCKYCGSKIFETDRSCVKCGAPISMAEVKRDTFGEFMRDVERGEPASFVKGGIGNPLLFEYGYDDYSVMTKMILGGL